MSADTCESVVPAGRTRLMVEHVDRRGVVSLLPLSPETERLFYARNAGLKTNTSRPAFVGSGRGNGADFLQKSATLTVREMQVFDLLISGLPSKKIAHELSISARTVEIHRANLMKKMGVRNAAALVREILFAA
jgi:FixJ family two-component response regulator